jgi:hypothetical protein
VEGSIIRAHVRGVCRIPCNETGRRLHHRTSSDTSPAPMLVDPARGARAEGVKAKR